MRPIRVAVSSRRAPLAMTESAVAPTSASSAAGRQGESASLAHALHARGVEGLGPDPARTEPLLFGIAGGIGVATMSFDMHGGHLVYLGTRFHTKETGRPELLGATCERLGIRFDVESGS